MTPDSGVLVIPGVTVRGRWHGYELDDVGILHLHPGDGRLLLPTGEIAFAWRQLSDATLAQSTLHLHRAPERLAVAGGPDVSRAWAHVMAHACAIPELARGLRSLGSSRGGEAKLQLRFFGPLLAARRRAESPESVDRRVAQFDAVTLGLRLVTAVNEMATERHPDDLPRRRALLAHLDEVMTPCHDALSALVQSGEDVLAAPDGLRFVAWRRWTTALRTVFVEADRSWSAVSRHLKST